MKTNNFVFDTNCLVSSLLIPFCVSQRAITKAEQKGILVFSEETFTELKEVLVRSKFDRYLPLSIRLKYIIELEAGGKFIETTSNFTDCRDVKDNKFLDLAVDSRATCLVSGDKDLLTLSPFHQVPIITPADFISLPF